MIQFAAGEKHWHGATPATTMTSLAIQEQLDGKTVDWLEKVSDEQPQGCKQGSVKTLTRIAALAAGHWLNR